MKNGIYFGFKIYSKSLKKFARDIEKIPIQKKQRKLDLMKNLRRKRRKWGETRKLILNELKKERPLTTNELGELFLTHPNNIRFHLFKLEKQELVQRIGKRKNFDLWTIK